MISGCVLNKLKIALPLNGFTINKDAVASLPCLNGWVFALCSSFPNALANANGSFINLAPVLSAIYSRALEIAN